MEFIQWNQYSGINTVESIQWSQYSGVNHSIQLKLNSYLFIKVFQQNFVLVEYLNLEPGALTRARANLNLEPGALTRARAQTTGGLRGFLLVTKPISPLSPLSYSQRGLNVKGKIRVSLTLFVTWTLN